MLAYLPVILWIVWFIITFIFFVVKYDFFDIWERIVLGFIVWIVLWILWGLLWYAWYRIWIQSPDWNKFSHRINIVAMDDTYYNKIQWWWGFIYVSINSMNQLSYNYIKSLWDDTYKQESIEWDVRLKEVDLYTWYIEVYKSTCTPSNWLMFCENPSVSHYVITIPKWSIFKWYWVDMK